MRLQKLFLGANRPNKAQLKYYSSMEGNLGQAIFLTSGGLLFLGDGNILWGIGGLIMGATLLVAAGRLLKEVKDL